MFKNHLLIAFRNLTRQKTYSIAWPLAYYFIDRWLGNFAYCIKIMDKWYIFFIAGIATLIIAFLTVLYQSIKAAITNPVRAIKYE